jgi:hypothetical protein
MPRTTLPALLVSVLATLALGTGCTTTVSGTAGAAGASTGAAQSTGDPVAWVDQVCGALLPFVRTAAAPPELEKAPDAPALISAISDYLEQSRGAADSAINGIAAAGPSPVDGGDDVVAALSDTLQSFRTSFEDAQSRVESVDPNDPQSLLTDLPAAVTPLEQLSTLPDPTADLRRTPELDRASSQAANCRQIETEIG